MLLWVYYQFQLYIMKHFILSILVIAAFSFTISSCGNKAKSSADTDKTEVVDKSGPEYTSAYVCPMHCKMSGSDKAGTCPVCKMDYVVNKDHKADGHDHGNHDGHDHGDHEGHNH